MFILKLSKSTLIFLGLFTVMFPHMCIYAKSSNNLQTQNLKHLPFLSNKMLYWEQFTVSNKQRRTFTYHIFCNLLLLLCLCNWKILQFSLPARCIIYKRKRELFYNKYLCIVHIFYYFQKLLPIKCHNRTCYSGT